MKILITGGAGFIGSHLQDAYLEAGHEVAIVDNLVTGFRKNINPQSIFFEEDICSPRLKVIFKEFNPDILNHHAAQMDVRRSVADPAYDAQVNILGMIHLLEAARESQVKKIIFSSTGGAIYGEQDYFPADESHPLRPASPYGLSKMVGEEYLKLYQRMYGLDFTIFRYANIYGPRQNPHGEAGVVAIFCKKLLAGEIPLINGDGRQTRDYLYVGDVVQANLMALKPEMKGIFNLGTSLETDVNTLATILVKLANREQIEHGPAKAGEQRRSVISSQLAKQTFGWAPSVTLYEGLQKTFEWFKR